MLTRFSLKRCRHHAAHCKVLAISSLCVSWFHVFFVTTPYYGLIPDNHDAFQKPNIVNNLVYMTTMLLLLTLKWSKEAK